MQQHLIQAGLFSDPAYSPVAATRKRGGRPAGVPNRNYTQLRLALEEAGCNIPQEIATLLHGDELSAVEKVDLICTLMPRLYPEYRAIDPDGYITIEQVMELQQRFLTLVVERLQSELAGVDVVRVIAGLAPIGAEAL